MKKRIACSSWDIVEIDMKALRAWNIVVVIYEEEVDTDVDSARDEELNVVLILNVFHIELMIEDEHCIQVNRFNEKN